MMKKNSKKTKPVSQAVVVQPVQLPVVTEQPEPRRPSKRILWGLFLLILNILAWGALFFCGVGAYHDYLKPRSVRPVRPVIVQPQHKQNVVAVIGDEEISLDEVKAFVADVPQLAEVPFEQVYPKILDMMINDKVISKGAMRYGIQKDPKIKKMIKMAGDQIVAQAYLAKEMERNLTEEDVRAVYDEEVKNFKPEDEIHARHILVLTEKQAKDIVIQLKAGADFGLLADQKSIDKNAPKGDLGYFTKEMMIPEFAEAVFAMKKGDLSGPIHTAYGWHVIQVEDRRPTEPPAFEQVKEQMQRLAVERKVPAIVAAERVRQGVQILRPDFAKPAVPAQVPSGVAPATVPTTQSGS